MLVKPIKNGLYLVPETDFETEYLQNAFTLSREHFVAFDHQTGVLKVVADAVEEDT